MGGAEKQCLLLAKALRSQHRVWVVILSQRPVHGPLAEFLETEALDHKFLVRNPIKKFFGFISFLKKNKIEVIFSFLPTDTILSAICGRLAGVEYLFGGLRNSHLGRFKFAALRAAHNYLLSYTVANNFAVYQKTLTSGFKDRVFVLSNGISIKPLKETDVEPPTEERGNGRRKISLISVGRLVKQKEYVTAIKCVAHLVENIGTEYDIRYNIMGHGPEEGIIKDAVASYGLEDQVEIHTDATEVYPALEKADIYLCTSSFEGISNAIMEAMNCALPIVATDAGDNARLVIHGKNGFIADIHDHETLARHVQFLVESDIDRIRMGRESHAHLMEYFGYGAFQNNYLKLIAHLGNLEISDGKLTYPEKI